MWPFDADYINHNNHRKYAEFSNNWVSMPTCVRNDSNYQIDSQNEAAVCYLG